MLNAQASISLNALTVPAELLANRCALKTIVPSRQERTTDQKGRQVIRIIPATHSLQPRGIEVNPWTGTDRPILAELRRDIDDVTMREPDGPPLSARQGNELFLQLADAVSEGYSATYAQGNRPDIGVRAIRFTSTAPSQHLSMTDPGRERQTIELGSIRLVVFGDDGPCASAIVGYLRSLKP
jgi:hypothetical protein